MERKGFTLIELLIVMAIIAILVGIALPRFRGMRDEANIAKASGELRALKTAIESYYMHQSPMAYPADTDPTDWQSAITGASPQIIETILYDPFVTGGTTEYRYSRSADGAYYVVWSVGVDGSSDISTTAIDDGEITSAELDDDIAASNGTLP